MSTPLGEEFIRIRPDVSRFRTELETQIAAAMRGVQNQVVRIRAELQQTAVQAAAAVPQAPPLVVPTGAIGRGTFSAAELAQAERIFQETGSNSISLLQRRMRVGFEKAAALASAATRTGAGGAFGAAFQVQAPQQIVVPAGAQARAEEATRAASAVAEETAALKELGSVARATTRSLIRLEEVQRRLQGSVGVLVPPGVRAEAAQATQAVEQRANALEHLGRTAQTTSGELEGLSQAQARVPRIVLPPGVRSVAEQNSAALTRQAEATANLGAVTQATRGDLEAFATTERRTARTSVVRPTGGRASAQDAAAIREQARATEELGAAQRAVGRVVLPAGVRDVANQNAAAIRDEAAATEGLANTASRTRGLILPPDVGPVSVQNARALEQQALATEQLTAAERSRRGVVQPSVTAVAAENTRALERQAAATEQLAAAERSLGGVVLPPGVRGVAAENTRALEQQTAATEQLAAAERTRSGLVLPAGVRTAAAENVRALEQQAAATEDVGAAARVARRDVAEFDATKRQASRGGIVVPGAAASIREQARATEELGAATAQAGRVVLPTGVRSVATRNAAAIRQQTEATDGLTNASQAASRVVLPSNVRSVSVQNAEGIRAQTTATADLGTAAQKTSRNVQDLDRLQRRASRTGIVIPGVAAASQRNTQALQQQAQATQQLGNVTQTTTGQLRTFQTVQQQTAGGVVLPPPRRTREPVVATAAVTQATNAQTAATQALGNTTTATNAQLAALGTTQRRTATVTRDVQRSIVSAETAIGRYSRGVVAATAASTGFFRAVSFASGAFLLGATIGATIGAAVQEFTQMTQVAAQTTQLIKATGGAANVTAKQVDQLSLSVLKLTGVDDELVKQGANVLLTFRNVRNEAGRGNDIFNRAVRAAADISSVFRTDLRGSAVQLGKALQDPERGVTALRRSGISLTQSQRELIKELVRSGAVLSAQKVILGEVERQVGGASEAIGRTLPGRLRIMREEALNSLGDLVKRLSESRTAADLAADASRGIGQAWGAVGATLRTIGPSLVGIAQGLGRATQAVGGVGTILAAIAAYVGLRKAIGAATRVTGLYAAAAAGEAQAALVQARATSAAADVNLASARSAQTAAEAALQQAQASGTVTRALTEQVAATTAAANAANAEAAAAVKVAAAAEERAAAELTAARAAQRSLSALVALNAVFAVGALASGQWVIGLAAAGFALTGLAAKARAAITALRAAGTAVTAFRVASLAMGGPLGIAAAGVGALVVGLLALRRFGRDSAGSLKATTDALAALNTELATNNRLRAAVGTARERVGVARFDVTAAQRDLDRARSRLASTQAGPGSLLFRDLQRQITVAQDGLTAATKRLESAESDLRIEREQNRVFEQGRAARITDFTNAIIKNIEATKRVADPGAQARVDGLTQKLMLQGLSYDEARAKAQQLSEVEARASKAGLPGVQELIKQYGKLADGQTRAARAAAAAILTITSTLNRTPTKRELAVIVRLSVEGASVNDILAKLKIINRATAEQNRLNIFSGTAISATLHQQVLALQGQLSAQRKKLTLINEELGKRRETLRAAKLELAAARDAVESAKESRSAAIESLAEAQRGLAQAQQSLRDTIRESADAVSEARQNLVETLRQSRDSIAGAIESARDATNQAIQDAKGNLLELNRSIATSLSNLLDKTGAGMDKLSARGQALRDRIIGGRGGPETLRAAQQVNFNLQRETPVDTDKIKQRFDDLTDSFVRGRINLQAYDKRFNALTRGLDVRKFKQVFGSEAANELLDTIKASRRQAVLIKESPKQIGGAIAQNLVNPIRTIKEGEKAIATATRDATRNNEQARKQLATAIGQSSRDIKSGEQAVADANRLVVKARTDIVKADRQLAAAERRLRQAQHIELKANTAEIKENAKQTKQLRIVLAKRRALLETKPKPQGNNTKQANRVRAGDIPLKEGSFILDLNGNLFG